MAERHVEVGASDGSAPCQRSTVETRQGHPWCRCRSPPVLARARVTTMSIDKDVLIELVAAGDAVTVVPSWIIAPYLSTRDVASVAVGDPPQRRS